MKYRTGIFSFFCLAGVLLAPQAWATDYFRAELEADGQKHEASLEELVKAHLALSEFEEALELTRRMKREGEEPEKIAGLLEVISESFEKEKDRILQIAGEVREQAEEIRRLVEKNRPVLFSGHARLLRKEKRFREAVLFYEKAMLATREEGERNLLAAEYRELAAEIEKAGEERKLLSGKEAQGLLERMRLFPETLEDTTE